MIKTVCDQCGIELTRKSRASKPANVMISITDVPTKRNTSISDSTTLDLCPKHATEFVEYLNKKFKKEIGE